MVAEDMTISTPLTYLLSGLAIIAFIGFLFLANFLIKGDPFHLLLGIVGTLFGVYFIYFANKKKKEYGSWNAILGVKISKKLKKRHK